MISMQAGLVQGLWRAVECPSMTIGGCFSSRRTFSSLMELWTRLSLLFQTSFQSQRLVFKSSCVNEDLNTNVQISFSSRKTLLPAVLPKLFGKA